MVKLDMPWNAPAVFVNMDSAGLHELDTESMPVLGRSRLPGAAVIRVMTGRDSRSVRALVPDGKVLDRGFHDVTLVDMNHVDGPEVPVAELDTLRLMWPVPRHSCGISLCPMRPICVALSCLQAKIANFQVEIDPP